MLHGACDLARRRGTYNGPATRAPILTRAILTPLFHPGRTIRMQTITYSAFAGDRLLATGGLEEMLRRTKAFLDRGGDPAVLIFEDQTGRQVDCDFRGTPTGIDLRRVVELGITPRINTGIAHKNAGVGQVGAGLVRPPLKIFEDALVAFADKYEL